MTTTQELINGALRLLSVLAEGETPSASMSQDALIAMNQMIDSWSIERLSVFSTMDQTFVWPANTITMTLGPTGDFVGERPIQLDDSTYFIATNNLSYTIQFVNEEQYNGISLKTNTSNYPQVIWVNESYPNISMSIYPKPTQDLTWHFISVSPLSSPATLSTTLSFPPGYLRAFRYNLACELAPEFGVEPSPQVQRIADISKRNLKRINNPNDLMSIPSPMIQRDYRFNIYTGGF